MYETEYRLLLNPGTDLETLEAQAKAAFRDKGMRWSDSRRAAPGIERFVTNIGSFLVLVGLAGLAVGGVGVSSAVRAYLEGKIATIATLKTLGAEGALIFRIYLTQIAILAALGTLIGLILGGGVPLLLAPIIEAQLPFPANITLAAKPLAEAAFYGLTTALLFTLWPLARTESVRAAALYRGGDGPSPRPKPIYLAALAALTILLIGGATILSGIPTLALSAAGGVLAALVILALAARGLRKLARKTARTTSDPRPRPPAPCAGLHRRP